MKKSWSTAPSRAGGGWRPEIALVALLMLLASPGDVSAQQRAALEWSRVSAPQDAAAVQESPPSTWRPLRIAKWGTAALAVGAALYGLSENREGDDLYAAIERTCTAQPERCLNRRPDGTYNDAELEAQYQSVRSHDRRARAALLTGQVSVAVSAALFILDLRNAGPPRTVPYDPDGGVQLIRGRDGGVGMRLMIRTR